MNRLLPFLCVLFLVGFSAAQSVFSDLPGASPEEKLDNIRRAVSQVRQYAAGQACWTEFFPNPADSGAIIRWSDWICAFLARPADGANCTWYTQYGENDTIVTTPEDLVFELNLKHDINQLKSPVTQEQSELFTGVLAKALATTGTSPGTLQNDLIEAFANVTAGIVSTTDSGCPAPDVTIQWQSPTTADNSVALNGLVSWVWADDLTHSVEVNGGETAVLVGFGSGTKTLGRTTPCTTASAAFPDGGVPCNLGTSGDFTYSQYFRADDTIDYHCNVHAGMTGSLTVGSGATATGNTNTNTAPVDVDATADGGDGGDGGSAGMKLSSWRF